jgi:hypothetical protein
MSRNFVGMGVALSPTLLYRRGSSLPAIVDDASLSKAEYLA